MAGDSHAVLIDELQRSKAALAECRATLATFVDACQGDGLPMLWRLAWAEALVQDLGELDTSDNCDPAALTEAAMNTRDMCKLLRQAITKAEPILGTDKAEEAAALAAADPEPRVPDNSIPF